jgi:hypothetical protein
MNPYSADLTINPLNMDWTDVRQVITYGQQRYKSGWCVVGPNRSGCYSIIKSDNRQHYCRKYKVTMVCELH